MKINNFLMKICNKTKKKRTFVLCVPYIPLMCNFILENRLINKGMTEYDVFELQGHQCYLLRIIKTLKVE